MGKTLKKVVSVFAMAATVGTTALICSYASNETIEELEILDLKIPVIEEVEKVILEVPEKPKFRSPNWMGKFPSWGSAKDIQSKQGNANCVKEQLKDINLSVDEDEIKLPNNISQFNKTANSCLTVEHFTKDYPGDKIWKEFKLVWLLKDENQGLLASVHVIAHEGKLMESAIAYFFQQSNGKWEIKGKKERKAIEIKVDNTFKLIPKAGTSIDSMERNYWGFNTRLSKICGIDECLTGDEGSTQKVAVWKFNSQKSENKSSVKTWTQDLKKWIKETFGWNKLADKMRSIKGTWKKN